MLDAYETTLRDGHRIKPIGNRFVILDAAGLSVGSSMRSETLAVKRLIDHRIAYAQANQFITGAQREQFLQQQLQQETAHA